jgi:hypothetical protein
MKDSSSKTRNIENPDIPKQNDAQLWTEFEYLELHVFYLLHQLENRHGLTISNLRTEHITPSNGLIPTRKMIMDLQLSMDRHQAIADELYYRAQMMR